MMETKELISLEPEKRIDFPNLLVRTHFGNVFFQSMIKNKRTIVYINPSEIIPQDNSEKNKFLEGLRLLKALNFNLIGFNRKSFDEHLRSVNWVNSYLSEDLVFPIFYQTKQETSTNPLGQLNEMAGYKNPVFFLDKHGSIIKVLNGIKPETRSLEKIARLASEMVLGEQDFKKERALRDN
ncbi:hypothetical protein SAMN04488057_107129 [Cyclobacterium lianum]|uniref:AhpC/TSA family protein n=1 Tax=Cyclobacterium lianum TaxID=388280 RepID=A0A1M7P865_9BACT|nr:hypothetical protein [Cyclobacterium lianum]SHN12928.1 hypothetical protein SAMN04488057_107129 [Cyclobacterium lianum]